VALGWCGIATLLGPRSPLAPCGELRQRSRTTPARGTAGVRCAPPGSAPGHGLFSGRRWLAPCATWGFVGGIPGAPGSRRGGGAGSARGSNSPRSPLAPCGTRPTARAHHLRRADGQGKRRERRAVNRGSGSSRGSRGSALSATTAADQGGSPSFTASISSSRKDAAAVQRMSSRALRTSAGMVSRRW